MCIPSGIAVGYVYGGLVRMLFAVTEFKVLLENFCLIDLVLEAACIVCLCLDCDCIKSHLIFYSLLKKSFRPFF